MNPETEEIEAIVLQKPQVFFKTITFNDDTCGVLLRCI